MLNSRPTSSTGSNDRLSPGSAIVSQSADLVCGHRAERSYRVRSDYPIWHTFNKTESHRLKSARNTTRHVDRRETPSFTM
ncbi:hypothetical protein KM043_017033 [Ampulex compressa]|nr:hypothetical protein KM043_017033 [Ampulex compressa]